MPPSGIDRERWPRLPSGLGGEGDRALHGIGVGPPRPGPQKKNMPPPPEPNRGFTTLLKIEPKRYSMPNDVKYR